MNLGARIMMFLQNTKADERTRSHTRYAAALCLGVTQILFASVFFYRLYVVGQPDAEMRDFQAVFGISVFGSLSTPPSAK